MSAEGTTLHSVHGMAYPQSSHRGLPHKLLWVAQAVPDGIDERPHMHVEDRWGVLGKLTQDERCCISPSLALVPKPLNCTPDLRDEHFLD